MASPRYTLNIKPEDLQPEQPKHEMTGKEKRENFWFYHKWHVIVGIVACADGLFVRLGDRHPGASGLYHRHPHHDRCAMGTRRGTGRASSSRILTTATATERSL